jgi:hypothetical protein
LDVSSAPLVVTSGAWASGGVAVPSHGSDEECVVVSLDHDSGDVDYCPTVSPISCVADTVSDYSDAEVYQESDVEPMYDVLEYDAQILPEDVPSLFGVKQTLVAVESVGEGPVMLDFVASGSPSHCGADFDTHLVVADVHKASNGTFVAGRADLGPVSTSVASVLSVSAIVEPVSVSSVSEAGDGLFTLFGAAKLGSVSPLVAKVSAVSAVVEPVSVHSRPEEGDGLSTVVGSAEIGPGSVSVVATGLSGLSHPSVVVSSAAAVTGAVSSGAVESSSFHTLFTSADLGMVSTSVVKSVAGPVYPPSVYVTAAMSATVNSVVSPVSSSHIDGLSANVVNLSLLADHDFSGRVSPVPVPISAHSQSVVHSIDYDEHVYMSDSSESVSFPSVNGALVHSPGVLDLSVGSL